MEVRKSKNIQIPREIFIDLCKWHIFESRDPEREQRIKQALEAKLKSTMEREKFSVDDAPKK